MSKTHGFIPERVAAMLDSGSLGPGTARTIAKAYADCSSCGTALSEGIRGGRVVDRDIEFEVACPNCESDQRVLVEEKVWGFVENVDSPLLPDAADTFELDDERILFLNSAQVYVSELV
jgi:DNA-directed RNA polymerase subunit RPC12/RpoP